MHQTCPLVSPNTASEHLHTFFPIPCLHLDDSLRKTGIQTAYPHHIAYKVRNKIGQGKFELPQMQQSLENCDLIYKHYGIENIGGASFGCTGMKFIHMEIRIPLSEDALSSQKGAPWAGDGARIMGYALQGLTADDDNLPHSDSFHAPSPSFLCFGQGVGGVNHNLEFSHVKEVEEKVHVSTVGDVHEREILLLGQ